MTAADSYGYGVVIVVVVVVVACLCTEIERDFMPWLVNTTADALHQQVVVRQVLDDMIRYVMSTRATLMDELQAQFEQIQRGAEEMVCMHTALLN